MLLTVALTGTFVLIGLAIVVGNLEARAQRTAWADIATRRRQQVDRDHALDEREASLAEESRELFRWESQLVQATEHQGCPACELRRIRGQRPAA